MEAVNKLPRWHSKDVLELSYATIDFGTQEIVWKPGKFTPKRSLALHAALSKGRGIVPEDYEGIA